MTKIILSLSWCAAPQLFENIEGGTTPHDSQTDHAKGVTLVPLVVQKVSK